MHHHNAKIARRRRAGYMIWRIYISYARCMCNVSCRFGFCIHISFIIIINNDTDTTVHDAVLNSLFPPHKNKTFILQLKTRASGRGHKFTYSFCLHYTHTRKCRARYTTSVYIWSFVYFLIADFNYRPHWVWCLHTVCTEICSRKK